jgi:hypothetical protein
MSERMRRPYRWDSGTGEVTFHTNLEAYSNLADTYVTAASLQYN